MVNYVPGTMPEERRQIVARFCSICDHYPDSCRFSAEKTGLYGEKRESDQERYAMRGYCGWASVNGRRAEIICKEETGDIIRFHNAETVPRSELSKKVDIEVIEPKRLPEPEENQ